TKHQAIWQNLVQLIDSLDDHTNIKDHEGISLESVCQDIVEELRLRAKLENKTLSWPEQFVQLQFSFKRALTLKRILLNLLQNSAAHAQESFALKIVSSNSSSKTVSLEISDDGKELPAQIQTLLKNPSQPPDNIQALGLKTCLLLAEQERVNKTYSRVGMQN